MLTRHTFYPKLIFPYRNFCEYRSSVRSRPTVNSEHDFNKHKQWTTPGRPQHRSPLKKSDHPNRKYWGHPVKDPINFVSVLIIIGILVWSFFALDWGESRAQRRQRMVRERIRLEYGLPLGWDDEEIEGDESEIGISTIVRRKD